MTIVLYVTLWLLSGFLAAWIGHKFADQGRTSTSYRTAFWVTFCGLASLSLVLFYILFHSEIMSKPIFKAKEKK